MPNTARDNSLRALRESGFSASELPGGGHPKLQQHLNRLGIKPGRIHALAVTLPYRETQEEVEKALAGQAVLRNKELTAEALQFSIEAKKPFVKPKEGVEVTAVLAGKTLLAAFFMAPKK